MSTLTFCLKILWRNLCRVDKDRVRISDLITYYLLWKECFPYRQARNKMFKLKPGWRPVCLVSFRGATFPCLWWVCQLFCPATPAWFFVFLWNFHLGLCWLRQWYSANVAIRKATGCFLEQHDFIMSWIYAVLCVCVCVWDGGYKMAFFFLQYPSAVGLCVRIAGW